MTPLSFQEIGDIPDECHAEDCMNQSSAAKSRQE
jgi:hypothetical protein